MESLLLFRRALASPTMCRFIPALSVPGFPSAATLLSLSFPRVSVVIYFALASFYFIPAGQPSEVQEQSIHAAVAAA